MFTEKQIKDIASIRYFIPGDMRGIRITSNDIEDFLLMSERGIGKRDGKFASGSGYAALMQGKRWREWHMRAWEQTILDGTIPLYELLVTTRPPRTVVDYMKKSMFKGNMSDLIETVYVHQTCLFNISFV